MLGTRCGIAARCSARCCALAGCVSSSHVRAPRLRRPAGDAVQIVGAADGPVDQLAGTRSPTSGLLGRDLPRRFGGSSPPGRRLLQRGPRGRRPGQYPDGVGCGAQPLEVENNAFYCQAAARPQLRLDQLGPGFPRRARRRLRRVHPCAGDGPRVRPRGAGAGGSPAIVDRDRDAGRLPRRQLDPRGSPRAGPALPPPGARTGRAAPRLPPAARPGRHEQRPRSRRTAPTSTARRPSRRGSTAGPEACRDDFGPDRAFTQGEFTGRGLRNRRRRALHPNAGRRGPRCRSPGTARSSEVFREDFTPPDPRAVRRRAHPTAPLSPTLDLVFCPDEQLVGYDERDLAGARLRGHRRLRRRDRARHPVRPVAPRPAGPVDRRPGRLRSAVCLTGWYAAKVFNGEPGVRSHRGHRRERPVPAGLRRRPRRARPADLTGFELVDLFRAGFPQGLSACDVGA